MSYRETQRKTWSTTGRAGLGLEPFETSVLPGHEAEAWAMGFCRKLGVWALEGPELEKLPGDR